MSSTAQSRRSKEALRYPVYTATDLATAEINYQAKGWAPTRWMEFIRAMHRAKLEVRLCKSKTTRSKYVYVCAGNRTVKVRFSNHRPLKGRELAQDSDYYVGISHLGVITTDQVIPQIIQELCNGTSHFQDNDHDDCHLH